MNKSLVAYFSATGTTERAAKSLAKAAGADLYRITPAVPYSSRDLNWNNSSSRSSVEMGDDSSRPALAQAAPDLSSYDVVFVGFPIWWYVEPRIVDTLLESCDLSGKAVVPFATSGSSGSMSLKRSSRASRTATHPYPRNRRGKEPHTRERLCEVDARGENPSSYQRGRQPFWGARGDGPGPGGRSPRRGGEASRPRSQSEPGEHGPSQRFRHSLWHP